MPSEALVLERVSDAEALERGALSLLRGAIGQDYAGRIALVSSFGAESVVLLDLVARINPATPVLFNETGMLFPETLEYQSMIAQRLGLTNVLRVRPTRADLAATDPGDILHKFDTDACCALRKVRPLQRALVPFDAWITGRKRHQSSTRAAMRIVEQDDDGRTKLNPLADWKASDLADYMDRRALPRHPLVSEGYPSIGCSPCTSRVEDGEDARAGRWRGSEKIECGIHYVEGRFIGGAGI